MLIALAPPAIRYPPTITHSTCDTVGSPAGVMNIGAMVVTSSSEMMRGLVRVTRSARMDGCFAPGGADIGSVSATASSGVRAEWKASTTSATHTSVPTSRCSARSSPGSRLRIMAAATPTWATVAASTRAAQRRSCRPSWLVPRETPATTTPSTTRKRKASARCVQWRTASGAAGGSADPLQSGKPRHSRPASKLATWAPNRITTKPSAAVASTSRCLGCRAERGSGARAAGSAPARSPTTSRVVRSTIALAKWVMTTQGGRTSFTVTAPRST